MTHQPLRQAFRHRQWVVAKKSMVAGMYRKSGCDVFASQLKTLVLSTPICSATSFWSIFRPSRRRRT